MISLFDDDMGEEIDVLGCVLVVFGDFMVVSWVVMVGVVVIVLVIEFIILDYLIVDELQVVVFVVGLGLVIEVGVNVMIVDVVIGQNIMIGYVIFYVFVIGVLVVQCGFVFEFEIRGMQGGYGDDYGLLFYIGSDVCEVLLILVQFGNGLMLVDFGKIEICILVVMMFKLCYCIYGVGMLVYDGYDSCQIFIGKLLVFVGGMCFFLLSFVFFFNVYGLL